MIIDISQEGFSCKVFPGDPEQYRHLIDEEKCRQAERRFGKIVEHCVLYRGPEHETEGGIVYQNVETYLNQLD